MTMSTKKELIVSMAECGITQKFARKIVESIFEEIDSALLSGEKVVVKNFGTFELRSRKGREMTNPRTGEKHTIPPRSVVHFTPARHFREQVEQSGEEE